MRFILSDKSDFSMIDNLSLAVHTFANRILMNRWDAASKVGELIL